MSSWKGANVVSHRNDGGRGSATEVAARGGIGDDPKRRSQETVEAALNRLSKAYMASMECVGAWQRADQAAENKEKKHDAADREPKISTAPTTTTTAPERESRLESLRRVGQTARKAFEHAILLDPLIAEHAPALSNLIREWASESAPSFGTASEEQINQRRRQRWAFVLELRAYPPVLTSDGHRSTVKHLAYLALVNYADLLISGCSCRYLREESSGCKYPSILDRGVVRTLKTFSSSGPCCWSGLLLGSCPEAHVATDCDVQSEPEEDTVRLALVSLIDASSLDGSDPTLWLKLGSAARRLGRLCAEAEATDDYTRPAGLLRHRRLEKYALEQAHCTLPPNVPPNRLAVQALREWIAEEEVDQYPPTLAKLPDPAELVLEVPRYSWSVLGRILMRACREGSSYSCAPDRDKRNTSGQRHDSWASPIVSISFSPMLTLPSSVLLMISSFLEQSSVRNLESTCRGMSSSMMSARAAMDHSAAVRRGSVKHTHLSQADGSSQTQESSTPTQQASEAKDNQAALNSDEGEKRDGGESKAGGEKKDESEKKDVAQRSRASLRLRSQIITSGKKAERNARRCSTEYCLLAAALGCTADDPTYLQAVKEGAASLASNTSENKPQGAVIARRSSLRFSMAEKSTRYKEEARERVSESSMASFAERWSSRRASPLALLFGFVAHASMHLADVFASDPSGSMVLASCLKECFELMVSKSKPGTALIPSWYERGFDLPHGAKLSPMECFAMDLLHIELRFKKCEREERVDTSFDGDPNVVSMMVPYLLQALETLDDEIDGHNKNWIALKVRCHWLVAGFYFWRGCLCYNVSESREAEKEGMKYIEEALECFNLHKNGPVGEVATPHLESPGRTGLHWKILSAPSLTLFRDEMQASSVVLVAREQFLEVTSKIQGSEEKSSLDEVDRDALFAIGDALLERYKSPVESAETKHVELINDFLGIHGEALLVGRDQESEEDETSVGLMDKLVPSSSIDLQFLLEIANPSILTILLVCLQAKPFRSLDVVRLLARSVICVECLHEAMQRPDQQNEDNGSADDFSDSDSQSSDDFAATEGSSISTGNIDRTKDIQLGNMMQLLIDRVAISFRNELNDDEQVLFLQSDDCSHMVRSAFGFSANWFRHEGRKKGGAYTETVDLGVFLSMHSCFRSFGRSACPENTTKILDRAYLIGLVRIVVQQRQKLSGILALPLARQGRAARHKAARGRADLLAAACCDTSLLLSRYLAEGQDGVMTRSYFFVEHDSGASFSSTLAILCDSLLWLWRTASPSDLPDAGPGGLQGASLDRSSKDRLLVPLAAAMVGLCGSAATTARSRKTVEGESGGKANSSELVCLTEFLDSDASATEWVSDGEETKDAGKGYDDLVRVIAQAGYCIKHVFGAIGDAEAVSYQFYKGYVTKDGPLLPLVLVRVLNMFVGRLLADFPPDDASTDNTREGWSEFPRGTRTTGMLLDSLLHRAYKHLHGFTLINVSDKESSGGTSTSDATNAERFTPESANAATMLYGCIMRAYSHGRKSPPKGSLETVLAALDRLSPRADNLARREAIRKYLFSTDEEAIGLRGIVSLVSKRVDLPFDLSQWEEAEEHDRSATQDRSAAVRRGISNMVAQGPLPSNQDTGVDSDRRPAAAHTEEELSRKFTALVDNFCYGEISDCNGWHKAAQCLLMKADLIADRLGLLKGFTRPNRGFYFVDHPTLLGDSLDIGDLLSEQERDARLKEEGCVDFLGRDLSLYVEHTWSSFKSLEDAHNNAYKPAAVEQDDDHSEAFRARVWLEIDSLYEKNNYIAWQQAWGGLFVSSLRKIAFRCQCFSLYVLYKQNATSLDDDTMISEITESLGTSLYAELMGGQAYGYPMHVMTSLRKRQLAEASLACFGRSIEVVKAVEEKTGEKGRVTWDLIFMMGKCQEKIANTYKREALHRASTGSGDPSFRQYERFMKKALQAYADSLQEAIQIEDDGEFPEQIAGGSAHGSTEAFYRLHASRLKCLIYAVGRREAERDAAELEALRLTECHWFSEPSEGPQNIRDRVWNVLADIVSAMAKCRVDQQFYHRSIYRHAQALMWAPVLCDPVGGRVNSSLGTVPATMAFKLRGLNYATHAAGSAIAVMSALFDKKRAQLCAVWVTANPTSAFQMINGTVRKYDAVRGKYISAYIHCLQLNQRRNALETLLRWTGTAPRDLPSFFAASSQLKGVVPTEPHTHDSLLIKSRLLSSHFFLTEVKRQANNALAYVIRQELDATPTSVSPDSKVLENHLKSAYACFLRLSCDTSISTERNRAWKHLLRKSAGVKEVVETLTTAYLRISNDDQPLSGKRSDWSGEAQGSELLEAAVKKCKEMFRSLSGSFYSKKKTTKPKKKNADESGVGSKRKEPEGDTVMRSFEVAVPQGLDAGEKFFARIQAGGALKTLRLTVPDGRPATLRFQMAVPSTSNDPSSKKRRADEEASR